MTTTPMTGTAAAAVGGFNPYQGLRPFQPSDWKYFCGRRTHVAEVMQRLYDNRLVAVVGLSGSGKSSLVRAGVIPQLRADRLKNTSSDWLVVMTTPGASPLDRLGQEFGNSVAEYCAVKRTENQPDVRPASEVEAWAETVVDVLKSGSSGLRTAIETAGLQARTRILLVIDQFEELFRYTRRNDKDDAESFVEQLLNVCKVPSNNADDVQEKEVHIDVYVIITMRSEYMGDCARFVGLAEAVNLGVYLTPRLNPDQLRQAITMPAQKLGRTVDPKLVTRLLNDVANDQDQLPVLQHALMRCWRMGSKIIGEEEYLAIGGSNALDQHAEEIFLKKLGMVRDDPDGSKGKRNQEIAEALFKRLTKAAIQEGIAEGESDGRRDPATLQAIYSQAMFQPAEVRDVIDVFRDRDCAFLQPSKDVERELPLPGDKPELKLNEVMIDITHESLIRKWKRLGGDPGEALDGWIHEEEKSADAYKQLVKASAEAQKAKAQKSEVQKTEAQKPDVQKAGKRVLSRRDAELYKGFEPHWNTKWARRYDGDYEQALTYLHNSIDHYKACDDAVFRKRVEKERRKWAISAAIGLAVIVLAGFLAFWIRHREMAVTQKTVKNVTLYDKRLNLAALDGGIMELRVPAAIQAALDAESEEIPALKLELTQLIPLDQWELFSAVKNGVRLSTMEDGGKLRSSCSVSVDPTGKFVALANGKNLRIWSLERGWPQKDTVPFRGVECVRFSKDGRQLIASAHNEQSQSDTVVRCSFEQGSVRCPKDGDIDSPLVVSGVAGRVVQSLVGSSGRMAVLTSNSLTVYDPDGALKPVSVPIRRSRVKRGVFSQDGLFLVISYEDGRADVLNLNGKRVPPKPLHFCVNSSVGTFRDNGNPAPCRMINSYSSSSRLESNLDLVQSAAFSPDSKRIVLGSSSGWITVLNNPFSSRDFQKGDVVGQMSSSINAVALIQSETGRELVAAGTSERDAAVFYPMVLGKDQRPRDPSKIDRRLRNLQPQFGARVVTLQGPIRWVEFADHGNYLITASADKKARVFEVGTGVEIQRVTHEDEVVFATTGDGNAEDGILSASRSGELYMTALSKLLVERTWPTKPDDACSPEASALSSSGTWAWACDGKIHVNDKPKLPDESHGSVVVDSLFLTDDGTAVAWLDHHGRINTDSDGSTPKCDFGIHYARWNSESSKWEITTWPPIWANVDKPPVMALSPDGDVVAVAFEKEPNVWKIQGLKIFTASHSVNLQPVTSEPLDGGSWQILSLALASDGSIAAGTAAGPGPEPGPTRNRVLHYFKSQSGDWKLRVPEWNGTNDSAAQGSNPGSTGITAVGFGGNNVLLAANSDQTIWNLEPGHEPARQQDRPENVAYKFVFEKHGSRVAAINGNVATFFVLNEGEAKDKTEILTKRSYLQEPGTIQALVFGEDETVVTSVATSGSVTKIKHQADVKQHEIRMCQEQPPFSTEDMKQLSCALLKKLGEQSCPENLSTHQTASAWSRFMSRLKSAP